MFTTRSLSPSIPWSPAHFSHLLCLSLKLHTHICFVLSKTCVQLTDQTYQQALESNPCMMKCQTFARLYSEFERSIPHISDSRYKMAYCILPALHCIEVTFIASFPSVYVDTWGITTEITLFFPFLQQHTNRSTHTHPSGLPTPRTTEPHSVCFSLDFNFQQWSTTFQHHTAAFLYFISVPKNSTGLWSSKWGKLINSALINDSGKAF